MPTLRKLLFAITCLLTLTLAGWLGSRYWLRSFLASEECRVWLGEQLSAYTGGEAQVARLQPESLEAIYSDRASLHLPSHAISLKADQLRANVRLQLFSRFCQIDRLDVTRVRLSVGEAVEAAPSAAEHHASTAAQSPESTERFVLHEVATADFNALWPGGSLAKSAVNMKQDPQRRGAWQLTGQNGTVRLHQLPQLAKTEWRLEELRASLHGGEFRLVNAALRTGREGTLSIQGSIAPEQPGDWTASFSGLPVETVADGDWRARLKGALSGRLRSHHASPRLPPLSKGAWR